MLRNKLLMIAVFTVAMAAIAGLADALALAPILSCNIESINQNGNYVGEPVLLGNNPGQYGYDYVFHPDGTYTFHGTWTNNDLINEHWCYIFALSEGHMDDTDAWVPAGSSVDFQFTIPAVSYEDISYCEYGFVGVPVHFEYDLSNVDHTTTAEQSHTVDQGPMSNGVAIYKDGKLSYTGLPQFSIGLY